MSVPVRFVKQLWGRSLVVVTERVTTVTWVEEGTTWVKRETVIPVGTNILTSRTVE